MATVRFFRDSLALDNNLPALLASAGINVQPGDTLVLGARLCTIAALPGGFHYVIGADKLSLASSPLTVTGTDAARSPNVTVLADEIVGPFNLICRGMAGANGEPGEPGENGEIEIINGKPHRLPPTPGGPGGNGEPGSPGGNVAIHFFTAVQGPTATAPGGRGGLGGPGGAAGKGVPRAANGKSGKAGAEGAPGSVRIVAELAREQLWSLLDLSSALAWSDYRTEVGAYFFRVFDPESQLIALSQFDAAILLNSSNFEAQILRSRIVHRQTPTGLSRDIDISPDYKDLSANLGTEAVLVQNAFAAAAGALQNPQTATGFRDQLTSLVQQLTHRAAEAQDNVRLAQQDVRIATAEEQNFSDQVISTRIQLDKLQHQSFDLGNFLTDVGSIVGSVASIPTGLGAIVSVPSAIIAFNDLNNRFGIIDMLNSENEFRKDVNPKKDFDQAMSRVGAGLTAFMKADRNAPGLLVNMYTFERELDGAGTKDNQTQAAQLLKQLVALQKQQMVARLRQAQTQDRVVAAQRQVQNLLNEAQTVQNLVNTWTNNEAFLKQAVSTFIGSARRLLDILAEDAFLARRALEIYQLEHPSDLRFDYGYLHPDLDHSLPPPARVTQSQNSIAALAPSVLTWNGLFTRLNDAQAAGFQVVHPAIAVSITDPAMLANLSGGNGLQFSIDANAMPVSIFELKANSLQLELDGATASEPAQFWIEHSGHWQMASRLGGMVEFTLFPHIEVFNCNAATGKLTATIPAQPQTSTEPGPPFSFWGRGVIGDWRIFPNVGTRGLDLSGLKSLKLTIQCIGFAALGAPAPTALLVKPVTTSLPHGALTTEPFKKAAAS